MRICVAVTSNVDTERFSRTPGWPQPARSASDPRPRRRLQAAEFTDAVGNPVGVRRHRHVSRDSVSTPYHGKLQPGYPTGRMADPSASELPVIICPNRHQTKPESNAAQAEPAPTAGRGRACRAQSHIPTPQAGAPPLRPRSAGPARQPAQRAGGVHRAGPADWSGAWCAGLVSAFAPPTPDGTACSTSKSPC